MSAPYTVLILDEHCNVTLATNVRGSVVAAVTQAQRMAETLRSHGYEVWHAGRRITACYDCDCPPARQADQAAAARRVS